MGRLVTVSLDLIVRDRKGRVLLGRTSQKWQDRGRYSWGLPGREVAYGENLKRSAQRNLREEVGMHMVSGRIVCINSNYAFGNHHIVIGILVKAKGTPINKRPTDWTEWKYFAEDEIPSQLFPSARLTLRAFFGREVSLDFGSSEKGRRIGRYRHVG